MVRAWPQFYPMKGARCCGGLFRPTLDPKKPGVYTKDVEEIDELIRKHDDFQFEVKLGYDLTRHRRKDVYSVEYFFFLPHNLDVNEQTYTKKQFYRDMLLYIRF